MTWSKDTSNTATKPRESCRSFGRESHQFGLQARCEKIVEGHKDIKKQLTVIKVWATNPK